VCAQVILITGGAGFIGSHIVDYLTCKGLYIKVLDNFSTGRLENIKQHLNKAGIEIINGDIKRMEDCLKAIESVDTVFHFAANPEVRVSSTEPLIHFSENLIGTFNILEAMRKRDIKEIVFASSSSVYGEPEKIPVDENAPIKPVSVYGATKAACENLIYAYSKLYGIRAIVLRYANVIGPRLRHGVIYDFIVKLKRTQTKLEILGDGTQIRSYIYITDAVKATIMAWEKSYRTFEVFNVASEDAITVKEVADIVIKTMGLNNIRYIYKPVLHGVGWPGDVKRIVLDISKLKSLGFKPKYGSRESIKLTAKALEQELR